MLYINIRPKTTENCVFVNTVGKRIESTARDMTEAWEAVTGKMPLFTPSKGNKTMVSTLVESVLKGKIKTITKKNKCYYFHLQSSHLGQILANRRYYCIICLVPKKN